MNFHKITHLNGFRHIFREFTTPYDRLKVSLNRLKITELADLPCSRKYL